jgi:hypothetical protein
MLVKHPIVAASAFLAAWSFAGVAYAGEEGQGSELDALKRRLEQQERRIRELEGSALTQDEVAASVDRYLASAPQAVLIGGADEKGSAGWPKGKKPFLKEGPNKLEFIMRGQVRYSAFLYSDDAVGTLNSPPFTLDDAAPRDRSGFEIERWLVGFQGNVFCEDISFHFFFNFDSDSGSGVEKEFAWIDWKYAGEHHVRGGVDKVPFIYEDQNSSGALAFVDRGIFAKAFGLDSDTGVMLWGYFGDCECPKRFLYRAAATTGEGTVSTGSVFNTDATDSFSDQLLFSGMLEWNVTCKDWPWDEVDHRACADRCKLDLSVGVSGHYENDDDVSHRTVGLALRSSGTLERWGASAWVRARYSGWSFLAEYGMRHVEYSSGAEEQMDHGGELTVHYRFADSNWGVGARGGIVFLDDDYDTLSIGPSGGPFVPVEIDDTIWEAGVVVNYFFWDHGHKISADVTWVSENSAVSSSSAGYFVNAQRGVVVEDGLMLRIQWQLGF